MKTDRKLISSNEYNLDQCKGRNAMNAVLKLDYIENYANFLNETLTLGQFVPCDLKGNVLTEPHDHGSGIKTFSEMDYQDAKDRVVFEGFEGAYIYSGTRFEVKRPKDGLIVWSLYIKDIKKPWKSGVESFIGYDLTLTPQAVERYKI